MRFGVVHLGSRNTEFEGCPTARCASSLASAETISLAVAAASAGHRKGVKGTKAHRQCDRHRQTVGLLERIVNVAGSSILPPVNGISRHFAEVRFRKRSEQSGHAARSVASRSDENCPNPRMSGSLLLRCAAPDLLYSHGPWVWGQRDEAARVHYAPRWRGRIVAACGKGAA